MEISLEAEKILIFISNHERSSPEEMSHSLKMKKQLIQKHLDDLEKLEFIYEAPSFGEESKYGLEKNGRDHLYSKGLL